MPFHWTVLSLFLSIYEFIPSDRHSQAACRTANLAMLKLLPVLPVPPKHVSSLKLLLEQEVQLCLPLL